MTNERITSTIAISTRVIPDSDELRASRRLRGTGSHLVGVLDEEDPEVHMDLEVDDRVAAHRDRVVEIGDERRRRLGGGLVPGVRTRRGRAGVDDVRRARPAGGGTSIDPDIAVPAVPAVPGPALKRYRPR